MLAHHLTADDDLASRSHAFIDTSVAWLTGSLGLGPGSRVLDLGCGPGLYSHRLARAGIEVLGVDVSRRSLEHARTVAEAEQLPARFRLGSYLEVDLGSGHDAAILIYEDYCVLSPAQRGLLLGRVREALRPGGRLVMDVTAAPRFEEHTDGSVTRADLGDGFWADPPYVGRVDTWTYPDLRLVLKRYVIDKPGRVDATGEAQDGWTREFWNWMQCLTPEEVRAELEQAGLVLEALHGDVAGAPYDPAAGTFAVTARHPG